MRIGRDESGSIQRCFENHGQARRSRPPAPADEALSAFVAARPRLFGIAYRVLGSTFDAEDVMQDVWLRWQETDRSAVRSVPAFLTTIATRLAINVVQSAHSRREVCSERRLPDTADASADPQWDAERREVLDHAMTLLLDKLSPTERAAYVLSEAFDYPCARIADLLRVSHANARQITCRARRRLAAEGRDRARRGERRRLLQAFLVAARTGEVATLERVLDGDIFGASLGRMAS